jgi:hypothetical protein
MIVPKTPVGGISEVYIASPTGDAMSFEVPFLNSEGGPVEIIIRPVKAGSGLQTNEAIDPDIPTLEEIARDMGINTTRPVLLRVQKNAADDHDEITVEKVERDMGLRR